MSTYRLEERIGRGGMGEVYAARRILPRNGPETRVACKTISPGNSSRASYFDLFMKEAKFSLEVSNDHRGIVTAYECIEDTQGRCHLVMEYIEGCTLEDIFAVFGHPAGPATLAGELFGLSGPVVWDIVRLAAAEVLDALSYIHEHGLIHSDVSPCNVMVSRRGAVKVADLGLARVAAGSDPLRFRGKWPYAAPEALRQQVAGDHRADLFCFAAMMYELITGLTVYDPARGLDAGDHALDKWEPPTLPDSVPLDLRALIAGLLRKTPDDRRPQTAEEAVPMLSPIDRKAARAIIGQLAGQIYDHEEEQRKRQPRAVSPCTIEIRQRIDVHADTIPLDISNAADDKRESQQTESAAPPARHHMDSRQNQPRISPQNRRVLTALAAVAAIALLGWFGYQGHGGKVAEEPRLASPAEGVKPGNESIKKAQTVTPIPTKRGTLSSKPTGSRPAPNNKPAARPSATRTRKQTCVAGGRCYTHRAPPRRVPSPYAEAAPPLGSPTGNPTRGTVPNARNP